MLDLGAPRLRAHPPPASVGSAATLAAEARASGAMFRHLKYLVVLAGAFGVAVAVQRVLDRARAAAAEREHGVCNTVWPLPVKAGQAAQPWHRQAPCPVALPNVLPLPSGPQTLLPTLHACCPPAARRRSRQSGKLCMPTPGLSGTAGVKNRSPSRRGCDRPGTVQDRPAPPAAAHRRGCGGPRTHSTLLSLAPPAAARKKSRSCAAKQVRAASCWH